MTILRVEHLTKDYKRGRGVFDISFEIKKGEVFSDPMEPEKQRPSDICSDSVNRKKELQISLAWMPGKSRR